MMRIGEWLRCLGGMGRGMSRGVKAGIAGNAALGILAVGLGLAAVGLTREIVDAATAGEPERLRWLSVVFVCVLLGRLLVSKVGQRLEAWCLTRRANGMRSRLFGVIMGGVRNDRVGLHSADVVNRLSTDVGNVASVVCSTFPAMVVSAAGVIGAFVYLATISPMIAVVVTLLMPVAIAVGKLPVAKSHRLTKEIREEDARLHRMMQENIGRRTVVATLGYRAQAEREFDAGQRRYFGLTMRRNDLGLYAGGAVALGFMGGYAVMFLYCAYGIAEGVVSFATMTALLQLVAMVQRPVIDLSHKFSPVVMGMVSQERLQELEHMHRKPMGKGCVAHGDELRLEGVWFRYGGASDEWVLRDFSARIETGKTTLIYGETGAGKTTLLRLLLGVCVPDRGRIVTPFDGADFGNVVYVPQGNTLFSGTIKSNLLMGKPDAVKEEIDDALRAAAADFVHELPDGLMTRCGESGYGLSEGQAQRIAIARGLLRLKAIKGGGDERVLFVLDEPTSALDMETEEKLMGGVTEYLNGVTTVMVTHKEGLRKYADAPAITLGH